MERDELAAWLRLTSTPGVGRESARRLLGAFGTPQAVLAADHEARRNAIGPSRAEALARPPEGFAALLQRTQDWLAADPARRGLITLADADYPPALLESPDPPLLLYRLGRAEALAGTLLAIVGSRSPTPQGRDAAHGLARQLGEAGLTIVSGLALGVDAAAHEGALAAGAATIAVVGTGLDIVYPRRHQALAERIADKGLMLSEYPLGTPPLAPHFPARNRIIAGLTEGTLVVEAALQSGSLITARLAAEAGREVFAVPGSIQSPQSRGCHALIQQGAKLVTGAADVLEELRLPVPSGAPATPAADAEEAPGEDPLLAAMGYGPVTLDALVERTGRSAAELGVRLLELELEGRVARLPGQLFQRAARA